MYINHIASYKEGWDLLQKNYAVEYKSITETIDIFQRKAKVQIDQERLKMFHIFSEKNELLADFSEQGWLHDKDNSYVSLLKNKVSLDIPSTLAFNLYKWFHEIEKAHQGGLVDFAVVIVDSVHWIFEICNIQPLDIKCPFVILCVSDSEKRKKPELSKIENIDNSSIVFDKAIEFPPEYYQAGIGILNYFSSYLHKSYPEELAKVKIEQEGQKIRLIVESRNGEKSIIEKALSEYQMIVTGQNEPEEFTDDKFLILELRTELKLAQFRIEQQTELLAYKQTDIDILNNHLKLALSKEHHTVVEVNPTISNKIKLENKNYICDMFPLVSQLKDVISNDTESLIVIESFEKSLKEIEKEQDPLIVQNSGAMKRIKDGIEKMLSGNDKFSKAIQSSEKGIDAMQRLAGKYNKLAEWCGLPVVPSVFTK